jgi:hypothetical protein
VSLSVTTIAPTRRLTTVENVKAELGITGGADDLNLARFVEHASAVIEGHCRVVFARERVTELLPGYGDIHLMLSRTPIISIASVLQDGAAITDWSIADREEGSVYRRVGWAWSVQHAAGLAGRQRWPGFGIPLAGREEPTYTFDYIGGYLLPGQDLVDKITLSAAAADNSFNDTANGFPALLAAGDVVEASGFGQGANNGRFLVSGTPTAGKIQVAGALVNESAGQAVTVRFRNRADGRRSFGSVERAAIVAVKTWHLNRKQAADVVERQIGSARVRYSEADQLTTLALPGEAVGLLAPFVRAA